MKRFKKGDEVWVKASFVGYSDGFGYSYVDIDGEKLFVDMDDVMPSSGPLPGVRKPTLCEFEKALAVLADLDADVCLNATERLEYFDDRAEVPGATEITPETVRDCFLERWSRPLGFGPLQGPGAEEAIKRADDGGET